MIRLRARSLMVGLLSSAFMMMMIIALFSLSETSWGELRGALLRIGGAEVVWITLASLFTLLLRTLRLCALFSQLSLMSGLSVCATHNALTRILPARSGELSLPALLCEHGGITLGEGALALIWLRLSEVIGLGCVTATVALFWSTPQLINLPLVWALCALGGLALFWARATFELITRVLTKISHTRIPHLSARLQWVEEQLRQAPRLSASQLIMIGAYTLAVILNQAWLFALILEATGAHMSYLNVLLGSAAVHLAGVIPAPTFGNVGTHELGWTFAYTQLGAPLAAVGASALLSQWLTLALALMWWSVMRGLRR